ncbi:TPA: hypothetical protein U2Q01_000661 [Burkholderia multivorans]|nr:hypothetical protein [Burkholderia multivorans]
MHGVLAGASPFGLSQSGYFQLFSEVRPTSFRGGHRRAATISPAVSAGVFVALSVINDRKSANLSEE